MKEHQIMLNATEDVKEFVNAASKCDFDIDISYNRIIIDAKSSGNSQYGSDQKAHCQMLWGKHSFQ